MTDTIQRVQSGPWGEIELDDGDDRLIEVGPLRLRLRRSRGELWLAHSREGEATPPDMEGEGVEWSRWALPRNRDRLRLRPVLPDRPLVVEPEQTFHLMRGAEIRVYVRVPVRVQLELFGATDVPLEEIPTVILSDTWFGDFMEGEVAYFLPTTARREMRDELFAPHLTVCPLQLSNGASEELEVKKIALRVAHLSIFGRDGELWADETGVHYRGDEVGSDLRMAGRAPVEARDAALLTPPRTPVGRSLRARTFARLRSLPGFGPSI